MKSKLFLIGGLGADKRVFRNLRLDSFDPIYIDWIFPRENEPIERYASRLISQYSIEENSILVGVSFGGMMMVEVARQMTPRSLILISSVATRNEVPKLVRILGAMKTKQVNSFEVVKAITDNDELVFRSEVGG